MWASLTSRTPCPQSTERDLDQDRKGEVGARHRAVSAKRRVNQGSLRTPVLFCSVLLPLRSPMSNTGWRTQKLNISGSRQQRRAAGRGW